MLTPLSFNSMFPAGVNVAATFDRGLAYTRGKLLGAEHRDKGVNTLLGPVAGYSKLHSNHYNVLLTECKCSWP